MSFSAAHKVALGAGLVAATAALAGATALRRTLPQTSGEVRVSGLDGPVAIDRDANGIPHIRATSDRDAFFAQGWCLAQDRRWQLDSFYRLCVGRLSEVVGPAALETDRLMRTIGFRRVAEAQVPHLSAESRMALEAYALGINACTERYTWRLPLEFRMLRYQPLPWDPAGSIAFLRYVAYQLSGNVERVIALGRCRETLGDDLFSIIFGKYPPLPKALDPEVEEAVLREADAAQREMAVIAGAPTAPLGSNAWAVSGSRTRSGLPLLAGDPHLLLSLPSIWYEASISSPNYQISGACMPGVPGIFIGRTDHIAWSVTASMLTCAEVYVEELNPDDERQYRTNDGWRDFERETQHIAVKGKPDESLEVRRTRNGVVISPVLPHTHGVLALKWVGDEPGDEISALLWASRARTWTEFRDALRHLALPAVNVVYADSAGNIGYQLTGRYPVRHGGGKIPVSGCVAANEDSEADHAWHGWIPFDALPTSFNPPSGTVTSANTRMVGLDYPFELEGMWEPPHRLARIQAMLEGRHKLASSDMRLMQRDLRSLRAEAALPRLRAVLLTSANQDLRKVGHELADWDGDLAAHHVAAALFEVWFLQYLDRVLSIQLNTEQHAAAMRLAHLNWGEPIWTWLERQIIQPDPTWFGPVDPNEVICEAMLETVRWFRAHHGPHMAGWTWGRLHTVKFQHPVGRAARILDRILSRGPYPIDGGTVTISASVYDSREPFQTHLGSSYRQVVDLGALESSLATNTLGQSGQVGSRHYDDQITTWLRHRYHPMLLSERSIQQASVAHLRLEPAHSMVHPGNPASTAQSPKRKVRMDSKNMGSQ